MDLTWRENQEAYNNWFLKAISKFRPTWYDKLISREDDDEHYYDLEIEPYDQQSAGIQLSNYGTELTVRFHTFHHHFDTIVEDDCDQELLDVLEFIDNIMNEEIVVITEYRDGTIAYSSSRHVNDLETYESKEVTIVSYRGSHNKKYNIG